MYYVFGQKKYLYTKIKTILLESLTTKFKNIKTSKLIFTNMIKYNEFLFLLIIFINIFLLITFFFE